MTTTTVPATREAAIATLVDQDCAKWGEAERAASQRTHQNRTIGLAINELANRAELLGSPDADLRTAANNALTDADWRILRQGG